ncbi:MAG: hypothetical protein R3F49_24520 [Planctomycetota bacterium]
MDLRARADGHDGRYRVEVDATEVVLRAGLGEPVLPRHPARGASR